MNLYKINNYDNSFVQKNMMGPNSMMLLEELTEKLSLKPGMRVLDLGCGKGLTSIFLAKEFGLQVFALDLWISATENYKNFIETGLENSIIPIHADALDMPFANEYYRRHRNFEIIAYSAVICRYFSEILVKQGKMLFFCDSWNIAVNCHVKI